MYGSPAYSGLGSERIVSVRSLVDAMKRRQILKPAGKFELDVGGDKLRVDLIASGHIEVNGAVQPLSIERLLDEALQEVGGTLDDVIEA